jgi:Mg-chelatase subunit ChlI
MMVRPLYPFSAIVGQDSVKEALILAAIDPLIGGVLVRGKKGTGKSTAVRGISKLLPKIDVVEGCPFNSDPASPFFIDKKQTPADLSSLKSITMPMPFVELPINATEDRVAGTINIEKAIESAKRMFEPGLLARANRGVLYIDEVNLLDDHLVDIILDAAASGVNVVEREGISFSHPSRFVLIGTMNPEEGELRPQLLDRFGLCVQVEEIDNIEQREEIITRRMNFDQDPEGFICEWEDIEQALADQIASARAKLNLVYVPDNVTEFVAELTARLKTPGHRADITLIKAARAHAAFLERERTGVDDVRAVAIYALFHRLPSSPFETETQIQQKIKDALDSLGKIESVEDQTKESVAEATVTDPDQELIAEQMQVPGATAAGSILLSFLKKKIASRSSTQTSN